MIADKLTKLAPNLSEAYLLQRSNLKFKTFLLQCFVQNSLFIPFNLLFCIIYGFIVPLLLPSVKTVSSVTPTMGREI